MFYYSQFGEDKFLAESNIMPKTGFFLDIGAGDPIRISNTYYFEQRGWKGICIDGDPRNYERLAKIRKQVILGVINKKAGLVKFNISDHGADLSSIKIATEAKKITVACFTVADLFREFVIPKEIDLLSIDIEGSDVEILTELFKITKPKIIIVEYDDDVSSDVVSVTDFFEYEPYKLLLKNQANMIYQRI